MAGLIPAMHFWWPSNSTLTLPGLDPGILFAAAEKDRRDKQLSIFNGYDGTPSCRA